MNGLGFMEGYTHLGSFVVIGEQTDEELLDRLFETIHSHTGDFKAGLSKLAVPGFSIRVMANKTQVIERIFADCRHIISDAWCQTKPSCLRQYYVLTYM